LGKP